MRKPTHPTHELKAGPAADNRDSSTLRERLDALAAELAEVKAANDELRKQQSEHQTRLAEHIDCVSAALQNRKPQNQSRSYGGPELVGVMVQILHAVQRVRNETGHQPDARITELLAEAAR